NVCQQLLEAGYPLAAIMPWLADEERKPSKTRSRNEPCPCGSGKKYKKCCGAQH
ncbi:SEC-C metal-binding domain-containing protein, partial [Klebsiella pneumoniae]|nr:SEC-C metal-binding domain-containing protein [Klebsiella pneumoniae]